jgi:uncharacterized RDD family membrane protein YckC
MSSPSSLAIASGAVAALQRSALPVLAATVATVVILLIAWLTPGSLAGIVVTVTAPTLLGFLLVSVLLDPNPGIGSLGRAARLLGARFVPLALLSVLTTLVAAGAAIVLLTIAAEASGLRPQEVPATSLAIALIATGTAVGWRTLLAGPLILSRAYGVRRAIRTSWSATGGDWAGILPVVLALQVWFVAPRLMGPPVAALSLLAVVIFAAVQVSYAELRGEETPAVAQADRVVPAGASPIDARILAHAFDAPILVVLVAAGYLLVSAAGAAVLGSRGVDGRFVAAATVGIVAVYLGALWTAFGATPGQRLVAIRVASGAGGRLSVGRSMLRGFLVAAPLAGLAWQPVLGAGLGVAWWLLLAGTGYRGRALHDRLVGSRVIDGLVGRRPTGWHPSVIGGLILWTLAAVPVGFFLALADAYGPRGAAGPGSQLLLASGLIDVGLLIVYVIYRRT